MALLYRGTKCKGKRGVKVYRPNNKKVKIARQDENCKKIDNLYKEITAKRHTK
jgi:hypothetical protein